MLHARACECTYYIAMSARCFIKKSWQSRFIFKRRRKEIVSSRSHIRQNTTVGRSPGNKHFRFIKCLDVAAAALPYVVQSEYDDGRAKIRSPFRHPWRASRSRSFRVNTSQLKWTTVRKKMADTELVRVWVSVFKLSHNILHCPFPKWFCYYSFPTRRSTNFSTERLELKPILCDHRST